MGSDWICEVLADLEMFARANELEDDLVNAVATAALVAKEKLCSTPESLELERVHPDRFQDSQYV
jgi:2-oxo-4-hydroxy-4-carboxy--5-ureidoimidazoline (OHCU) decarboxylase